MNHITLAQPLEQDTYQASKITVQNERYLNHISLVARKLGEFPSLPGTHILIRRAEDWRPKVATKNVSASNWMNVAAATFIQFDARK